MKQSILPKALKHSKRYLVLIPIFSILISYLTLQVPMYVKYAIDIVLYKEQAQIPTYLAQYLTNTMIYNIGIIVLFLLATSGLIAIISYIRNRISNSFDLRINQNLKIEIFKHIQKLEYQSYVHYNKTEMMQRLKEDTTTYANFFNVQLNLLLDTFFIVVFMIRQSIQINTSITLYILVSILFLFLFGLWYYKKLDKIMPQNIKARKELLSKTIQATNHYKISRIFNKQKEEIEEYRRLNEECTHINIKLINLILFHEIITDSIQSLSTPIIYMIGGIAVILGQLTFGSLVVLVTFAEKVMGYGIRLGNSLDEIDEFVNVSKLLNQLMTLEEEKPMQKYEDLAGDILFLNVGITLETNKILENLNFQIHPGEKIAIIGDNGVRKKYISKNNARIL